jgi:hypothetical protein
MIIKLNTENISEDTLKQIDQLDRIGSELNRLIAQLPDSEEKSNALRCLKEAAMWTIEAML